MSKNGIIPWANSTDMKWFRHVTYGKDIIMGSNTYNSLPKKGLPNRNIHLLSRTKHAKFNTISSKEEFIQL